MNLPLHPFFVHFPIGFLIGALILHAVHLIRPNWICRVIGLWLTGLSGISSMLASITGQWEFNKTLSQDYSQEIIQILERHQMLGNIVTWGTIVFFVIWVNLFFKKMSDHRIDQIAFFILLILVGIVLFTAYLGGTLVWKFGVGIQ
ncbi:MAG: DUF2231 domain-containing protein [Candidatus Neomarinimicrobiota bacterium]|nr:DUF2231 domain-containing protein [Candidatus Neomarinimicrobiota bacterium]